MLNEKYKLSTPINLLFLLFAILSLSCTGLMLKDSVSVSGFWEAGLGDTTRLSKLYYFDIYQQGDSVYGTAETMDTSRTYTGNIYGNVVKDSVLFNVKMQEGSPDLVFKGIHIIRNNERFIAGEIKFGAGKEENITLSVSRKELCIINPELNPNNPYKFEKYIPPNKSLPSMGQPVIFVHGMTGSSKEWDEMLNKLDTNFFNKHEVWLFQYKWETNIQENGKILYDSIIANRVQNPIIVCHSMGGLVARAYVSAGGEIEKLVTLGTPHLGSPLVMFSHILCWANQPGVLDMIPNSEFLNKLNSDAKDLANRKKYYTIAGEIGGYFKIFPPVWKWNENYYGKIEKDGFFVMQFMGENSDGIVPLESALFINGNTVRPLPIQKWVDHLNLANPDIAVDVFDYISSL